MPLSKIEERLDERLYAKPWRPEIHLKGYKQQKFVPFTLFTGNPTKRLRSDASSTWTVLGYIGDRWSI